MQQDIEVISDKLIKTELITMNTEFDLGKSIIHKTELVMNNYIDIVVRNIVNRVIIDKNGIKTVLL